MLSGQPILVFDHISGEQAIAGDWTVTAVRTANAVSSPVPGSELTLSFASGTTSGYAGCNQFTGGYKLTGDDLTIGPLASTRRACVDPAVSQQETDYLAALQATATFSSTSQMLTLLAADGTITVTRDARRSVGQQRSPHLTPGDQAESRTIRQLSETNSTWPISSTVRSTKPCRKHSKPVDVGEVRRQADRDADRRDEQVVRRRAAARAARGTTPPRRGRTTGACRSAPRWWATSPAPGLQKHPVRSEMLDPVGQLLDPPVVDRPAVAVAHRERHRAAAVDACRPGRGAARAARRWRGAGRRARRAARPSGTAHGCGSRRARCARGGRSPVVDRRQVEVVDGAVLERRPRRRAGSDRRPGRRRW